MKKKVLLFVTINALFLGYSTAQVAPLLSTTWGQKCYYNADCPSVGSGGACGKAYTGCYATAVAQIFKYYGYPSTGAEQHCNSNVTSECVDFSMETYNYATMPNSLTAANTEVAKLMYDIGVANDMQWGGAVSSSYFQTFPLVKYFKYSPKMSHVHSYMYSTTQDLIAAIKKELDAGRIVFCKANAIGHFYLIDGYNSADQFHCNFGWEGTYNGYYDIDNVMTPVGNATPDGFIFNIMPPKSDVVLYDDTVTIPAHMGLENLTFLSLQNWTISSPTPWITLNQTSGNAGGYYSFDNIGFNYEVNNNPQRTGYIYIDDGTDRDTITVIQDASPLKLNPDSISFSALGGTQTVDITFRSWMTWNDTISAAWVATTPDSGTDNDTTISVVVYTNTLATPRQGYIAITVGSFKDSIFIYQGASITTTEIPYEQLKNNIKVYPNPTNDKLIITLNKPLHINEIKVINAVGKVVRSINPKSNYSIIDVSLLPNGIYLISMQSDNNIKTKRFIKK